MEFNFNVNAHVHYAHGELAEVRCLLGKIMSAISDFADKMAIHNNKVDAAVDGLTADVASLKQMITDLQNSQGQISADDQAKLDAIEAKAGAVADRVAALDELTPPPAPATP